MDEVKRFLFKYQNPYRYFEEAAKGEFEFECLMMSESDVGKFYKKVGKQIDKNGKGYVPIDMLLEKLKLKPSLFTTRLFAMLDPNEGGLINFSEFLLILWNFLTVDPLSLGYILFDIYDVDMSGTFEFEEVLLCVEELFGDKPNEHAKKIMEQLDELNFLAVTNELFNGMCKHYRDILNPVRKEQLMLRKHFFGVKYWEKKAKARESWTENKYYPLKELLKLQAKRLNIKRRNIYRGLHDDTEKYFIKPTVRDVHHVGQRQNFAQRGITVPEVVYQRSAGPEDPVGVMNDGLIETNVRNQSMARNLKGLFAGATGGGGVGGSSTIASSACTSRTTKSKKTIVVDPENFYENKPRVVKSIVIREIAPKKIDPNKKPVFK
jgi:Ca2+-binding EF-hand superfamily protein